LWFLGPQIYILTTDDSQRQLVHAQNIIIIKTLWSIIMLVAITWYLKKVSPVNSKKL